MQIYSETGEFRLYQGSMLDMLSEIRPNSIDSIVTDPPYELNFMNKGWDSSGIAFRPDTWRKCYAVLKSGGYLLAFGGSRTFHRIACAIEDAGFEIRDTIMWLYGSGFPKSMNIGLAIDKKNGVDSPIIGYTDQLDIRNNNYNNNQAKRLMHPVREPQNEWAGWGTALKPAYEPVIVARKPCEGSCIDNVIQYGVGGINLDECRIGDEERSYGGMSLKKPEGAGVFRDDEWKPKEIEVTVNGRYPSNVILTYDDTDKDEVIGGMPCENGESAARFFYTAKASKRDRDEGLDQFEAEKVTDGNTRRNEELAPYIRAVSSLRRNIHPTVKPTDLMQYLVRLVTPKGGTVLDPFNGSGSTGKAVMYENRDRNAGYKYIGIELTAEYLPISDARIRYAAGDHAPNAPLNIADEPVKGQITFFDLLGGTE